MAEEPKESFNMAVATLMRLDSILKRMELVSEVLDGTREQKLQIKLLRHFLLNASPLMSISMTEDEVKDYKKRILDIKIPSRLIKGKRYEYYSSGISDEMLSISMEIQTYLKNFFMPPTKRKRMF